MLRIMNDTSSSILRCLCSFLGSFCSKASSKCCAVNCCLPCLSCLTNSRPQQVGSRVCYTPDAGVTPLHGCIACIVSSFLRSVCCVLSAVLDCCAGMGCILHSWQLGRAMPVQLVLQVLKLVCCAVSPLCAAMQHVSSTLKHIPCFVNPCSNRPGNGTCSSLGAMLDG
jgi:hypothetical protein